MTNRRLFLLCCFLSLLAVSPRAQETTSSAEESAEKSAEESALLEEQIASEPPAEIKLPPDRQRIEIEIKTSTLPELAAWCRSLGLSEGGTRTDLAKRLRDHFELPEPRGNDDENRKVITIESAQTTEYFKIEVVDEEYARLKGDVNLILREKDAVHTIKANEILFNRTRNILTAKGGVSYERVKNDTTETFYGETITVNIDNWSSIFLDGSSVKKFSGETSAYRFTGSVITRNNSEDVMVLRNAQVSNADSEEAYWSISATKLLLLPGSDFYIFNAVLKVGEIPVLYFPAFYFPADEVIFHPALGYRSREGGFVQTTTYILGRPKANKDDTNSLSRILGNSNDMEKEQQGLFLRTTGKKVKDPNEITLKALIDYYTNLGAYMGLDFSVPSKVGILSSFDLTMGVGFTRTLPYVDGNYTPYAPNYDGTFDWNRSNFFSLSVPFRYRLETKSSINGTYGGFSWNFPYYSDPYVDMDFLNRAETMDWLNMIQQKTEDDTTTTSQSTGYGSYSWNINGRLTPSLKFLSPYVSSISFNTISTTMSFAKIRDINITDDVVNSTKGRHPGEYFFAPNMYTIYNISGSISGNPLSINGAGQSAEGAAKPETDDILKGIGVPRSPWAEEEVKTEENKSGELLTPPVLAQNFELPKAGNSRFNVNYSLRPSSSTELQFRSGYNHWQTYEDVDWSEVQSILSIFSADGDVIFKMDHTNNLYSNEVKFSGNGNWREYGYINEEAEKYLDVNGDTDPDKIADERRQQYGNTNYNTSYAYTGRLQPLYRNPVFGQSNLQYGFSGTLVRSKRFIAGGDKPELSPNWGGWVKPKPGQGQDEDILGLNSHQLAANLAASIMDKQQSITLSATLPPLDGLISANATFRAWISETTAKIIFKNPEMINNEPNNEWKKDPLYLGENLKLGNLGSFNFNMNIDLEENNEIKSMSSSLNLGKSAWAFRTAFEAKNEAKYEFVPSNPANPSMGGKWEQYGEPVLSPTDLTFNYTHTLSNTDIIKNRISFSTNISSGLAFKLQKYTSSNFTFSLGFNLNVAGFLDLDMTLGSGNAVIWRYFKNVPGMEDLTFMYPDGPQNNLFTDLFDSFNFADDDKRRRSGFKMKGFNLKVVHYLGDWTAELKVDTYPELNPNAFPPKHEINTNIEFLVKWSVIPEIKKNLKYEQKTDTWTTIK